MWNTAGVTSALSSWHNPPLEGKGGPVVGMGENGVRMPQFKAQRITEVGKELQAHQIQPPTISPRSQELGTGNTNAKFPQENLPHRCILRASYFASSYPMENAREALSIITISPLEKLGCVIAVAQLS